MAKQTAKCPECGKRLEVDPAAGGRVICPHCQASLRIRRRNKPPEQTDPLIGQRLGEFEIVEPLGRGGMGAVYKARQPSLGRLVAIKVLPASLSANESFVARFDREARAAAAVSHPNIIEIHAVGEDRGHPYIAMELIDGETLSDVLEREGRLPPDRALAVMKQTAAALAEAHEHGILHRDIKPANILLDAKGRVKVADFGLAKRADMDVTLTLVGATLGTPLYMSPDAARGLPADARSDLYSLGATFYQAIAGRPPFDGQTPAQVILKHAEAAVPPLGQLAPDTPAELCRIIHRLLRKNPDERYPSAEALLGDLERVEVGGARRRSAVRASLDEPRNRQRRRRRLALLAGIGAAAVAVVAVLVLPPLLGGRPTRRAAPPAGTIWPFDAAEAKRRQQATAEALGVDVEETIDLGGGVKMTFVLIPAGEFLMGSPPTTSPEELEKLFGKDEWTTYTTDFPQHRVRISRPFWLGKTEVTQEQWQAVMGDDPSGSPGRGQNPVDNVSWEDCQQFLLKLSATTGKKLRLPAEAEWEYACRAGAATAFYFGDNPADLDAHAWHSGNAVVMTQPVGKTKPNAWGLYDMAGNVWEWCEDWHGPYGEEAETDPEGPGAGNARILRGGSWRGGVLGNFLNAHRGWNSPSYRSRTDGFRVARTIGVPVEPLPGAQATAPASAKARLPRAKVSQQQVEEARKRGVPATKEFSLPGGKAMRFVYIPPGTFTMGSPATERDRDPDETPHEVTLTKGFYLGVTEVTQGQWRAVMGPDPSGQAVDDELPMARITWVDCQNFVGKLPRGARLPTEAEWEYACRAGSRTRFSFGDSDADLNRHAWYLPNSGERTHPVGRLVANAWGLFDMHGNVLEWCADSYGPYAAGPVTDPPAPTSGPSRVRRGGCCMSLHGDCRSARREQSSYYSRTATIGLRVALDPE